MAQMRHGAFGGLESLKRLCGARSANWIKAQSRERATGFPGPFPPYRGLTARNTAMTASLEAGGRSGHASTSSARFGSGASVFLGAVGKWWAGSSP